jgi:hypothetical protein
MTNVVYISKTLDTGEITIQGFYFLKLGKWRYTDSRDSVSRMYSRRATLEESNALDVLSAQ